jgi:hypothetical protein
MEHWQRTLVPDGFKWTHTETTTSVLVQIQDNRWTAVLALRLATGETEKSRFFVEDCFDASLQKCLLYVWRALSASDRTTFDLHEAYADLRRFVG